MNEEQTKTTMRTILKCLMNGDVNQFLSFAASDAIWITPFGTFKGSEEIKNYATWMCNGVTDFKIVETGIGIIVQGTTGIIEHDFSGIMEGKKFKVPSLCIYEFKDDKFITIRTFVDRLCFAEQTVKGIFPKLIVNAVVKGSTKGL